MAARGKQEPYLILCDGAQGKPYSSKQKVCEIRTGKGKDLVHIQIDALKEKMRNDLAPVMKDLLEIATFVYIAGQLTSRGGMKELEYGHKWHREFDMAIPVRECDLWRDEETKERLESVLSFVAGEQYRFHFTPKQKDNPEFFEFGGGYYEDKDIAGVMLFSGGLDSFSGAVDEVVGQRTRVALVSHRSDTKMTGLQRNVWQYLDCECPGPTPLHVPVKICKGKGYATKDTNQRSRSFLFAALGATVAHTIGLNEVKFYENGIVSCNLPFDNQTPQARRTRSTHPRFLKEMSELVEKITGKEFVFTNPYFQKTRTEVVRRLVELHHQAGIGKTRSCAKSRYSVGQRHDGVCSQCVGRRFATIAAGCLANDPQKDYKVNIFTDELEKTQDRTMAIGFTYLADKIEGCDCNEFYTHFSSDIVEIANHMDGQREAVVQRIYELHKRHANQVNGVLEDKIAEHKREVRRKDWPKTCLLELVVSGEHRKYPKIAKQRSTGEIKHGKGGLETKVKGILEGNPTLTSQEIAERIGRTSDSAVRQTKAWKTRPKKK